MSANRTLPAINPLRVRSTLAAILSLLAVIGPLLGGGLGEMAAELGANADLIQSQTERVVDALNALIGVGALLWFWLERRAPNARLSFRAPLSQPSTPPVVMILLVALLALAWSGKAAAAQGMGCLPPSDMAVQLADGWGEARRGLMLADDGAVLELYANVSTGTWTLVQTAPGGLTCIVAAGDAFEGLKDAPVLGQGA